MRNMGLKNSNYCMTVVGVAPPLYVTRKILYGILVHQRYSVFTVQSIWRRRVIKDILLAFWLVSMDDR